MFNKPVSVKNIYLEITINPFEKVENLEELIRENIKKYALAREGSMNLSKPIEVENVFIFKMTDTENDYVLVIMINQAKITFREKSLGNLLDISHMGKINKIKTMNMNELILFFEETYSSKYQKVPIPK